ncbi:Ig-like domain-containing protein [Paenibacillus sp. UMB4589-SE434]|uniref:Ig-like domain-containing protein n=1 Tax=Paenibacillus sp. UMB4589-SE434 TaxID=3046314 RepID=UPI00254ABD43|nr:Ig-like domain-containing protein [Paenibacillus sp. UMB4589-SE434]MDK8179967.1 Ig-like domain-containing protein [Paenibacillus sp. UMB4589-SE434]
MSKLRNRSFLSSLMLSIALLGGTVWPQSDIAAALPSIPQTTLNHDQPEQFSVPAHLQQDKLQQLTATSTHSEFLSTSTISEPPPTAPAAINNNPNSAIPVVTSVVYSDKISEANGERWYTFQTTTPGKVTVYLQTVQNAAVDYNLHLFRLDTTTYNLVEQEISSYGPQTNEQISRIAPAGIYYVAVNAQAGFDAANPYLFTIQESPVYDSAEPDDNVWRAKPLTDSINLLQQTLDNLYDEDWVKLTVTAAKSFRINFTNSAPNTNYQVQLFNQNLQSLGTINQNTDVLGSFAQGTYYIRVLSLSSYNAVQPYKLTFTEFKAPTQVNITHVSTISDVNAGQRINYGEGYMWRFKDSITITGLAKDASGAPAFNAPITVAFLTKLNNKVYQAQTTTSANGTFSVTISGVQPAIGQYSAHVTVSRHYYDIIPLQVYYNGSALSANDTTLYHYAYSIWTGS